MNVWNFGSKRNQNLYPTRSRSKSSSPVRSQSVSSPVAPLVPIFSGEDKQFKFKFDFRMDVKPHFSEEEQQFIEDVIASKPPTQQQLYDKQQGESSCHALQNSSIELSDDKNYNQKAVAEFTSDECKIFIDAGLPEPRMIKLKGLSGHIISDQFKHTSKWSRKAGYNEHRFSDLRQKLKNKKIDDILHKIKLRFILADWLQHSNKERNVNEDDVTQLQTTMYLYRNKNLRLKIDECQKKIKDAMMDIEI